MILWKSIFHDMIRESASHPSPLFQRRDLSHESLPHAKGRCNLCTWRGARAQNSNLSGTLILWCHFYQISLLYEVPGGNLVDGLPPAASTGAGCLDPPTPLEHCPEIRVLVWIFLAIPLVDLRETLGNTRYMCDINFCKVSLLSIDLALSLSHPKPRLDVIIFMMW